MMTVNEIINQITGRREDGSVSSIVSFSVFETIEGKEPIEREFASVYGPEVHIRSMLDKVMMDIVFVSDIDVELRRLWNILESFGKLLNESGIDEREGVPVFYSTILPIEYDGKVYSLGANPVTWSLTALEPGKPVSTIRLVFDAEDLGFYESDNLDVSDIDTEIAMEESKRDMVADVEEKRRQQKLERMQHLEKQRQKYL